MLKEPSTPSAVFNSKIRGKKIELTKNDNKLISNALSLIWSKTNKKVDICRFEKDMATVTYLKNEGRLYFDLFDQESQDTENLQKKLEKHKKNESHYLYLYEHYKRKCESLENELHELRKAAIGDTTMDTVVSDEIVSDDGINELIDELSRDNIRPPEPSTTLPPTLYSESTTPGSIFYPKRDSEFARLVNCDLAMNDLATSNSPDDIWANLNK
ncbi:unnamed protein product [Rhizophagus irregularis]|nr:unnamed protein product [Rhizophagus irregularis]CAB4417972.1 unnamed protein product [Rhizophagus irregularis]